MRTSRFNTKVVRSREPATFRRENVTAIVIYTTTSFRENGGSGKNKLSKCKWFDHFAIKNRLNAFNKNNRSYFAPEKQ